MTFSCAAFDFTFSRRLRALGLCLQIYTDLQHILHTKHSAALNYNTQRPQSSAAFPMYSVALHGPPNTRRRFPHVHGPQRRPTHLSHSKAAHCRSPRSRILHGTSAAMSHASRHSTRFPGTLRALCRIGLLLISYYVGPRSFRCLPPD